MTLSVTLVTPSGFLLEGLHGMGHLYLQDRVVWDSLLQVTGYVQPVIIFSRWLSLSGVDLFWRQSLLMMIGIIARLLYSSCESRGSVEVRLVI